MKVILAFVFLTDAGLDLWPVRPGWEQVPTVHLHSYIILAFACCWAVRRSWFAWVNALCHLSHRKLPLPGQFLSRGSFMLCLTVEVEKAEWIFWALLSVAIPCLMAQNRCFGGCSFMLRLTMEAEKAEWMSWTFSSFKSVKCASSNYMWTTLTHVHTHTHTHAQMHALIHAQ